MKTLSRDEVVSEDESVLTTHFKDVVITREFFDSLDLRNSTFQNVHFNASDFEICKFQSSLFTDCRSTSSFVGCNFTRSNFTRCMFETTGFDSCNFYGSHFRNCDFRFTAYLYASCNFVRCDFEKCRLFGEEINSPPLSITGLHWPVLITPGYMAIGCQRHTHLDWTAFSDITIELMDDRAKGFWSEHRKMLLAICTKVREKANT